MPTLVSVPTTSVTGGPVVGERSVVSPVLGRPGRAAAFFLGAFIRATSAARMGLEDPPDRMASRAAKSSVCRSKISSLCPLRAAIVAPAASGLPICTSVAWISRTSVIWATGTSATVSAWSTCRESLWSPISRMSQT